MNLILWFLIGIIIGVYNASLTNRHAGERIFIALSGSLIGGFAVAFLFGYSINGLNPLAIIASVVSTIFTLRYFEKVSESHTGENNERISPTN